MAASAPAHGTSDLRGRVVAGIPAAAFAILIVAAGNPIFTIGAILLGLACLHELFGLFDSVRPARLAGFLALIALAVAADAGGRGPMLLVLMLALPVVFALTVAGPSARGGAVGVAIVLLGVWWIGLTVAYAVLLRDLPHGGGIVIDVLVGTFVGDSGAYFGGRWFGRRRLAPRISPNKTLEGLVLGLATAIISVWVAGTYQDWLGGWDAILLGLAVGIAAPVGDLFESFVKRSVGTKDTGRLFGAHGGALDRLDAALFTLVAGYYVWVALLPR